MVPGAAVFAALQVVDVGLFDVKVDHRVFAGEFHGQWQADDAEAQAGGVEGG